MRQYPVYFIIDHLLSHVTSDVIKDVQDEMSKGGTSGQIFAVVHIGKFVLCCLHFTIIILIIIQVQKE